MLGWMSKPRVPYFRLCSKCSLRGRLCHSSCYRARDVSIPSVARSARAGPNVKATLRGARLPSSYIGPISMIFFYSTMVESPGQA